MTTTGQKCYHVKVRVTRRRWHAEIVVVAHDEKEALRKAASPILGMEIDDERGDPVTELHVSRDHYHANHARYPALLGEFDI